MLYVFPREGIQQHPYINMENSTYGLNLQDYLNFAKPGWWSSTSYFLARDCVFEVDDFDK